MIKPWCIHLLCFLPEKIPFVALNEQSNSFTTQLQSSAQLTYILIYFYDRFSTASGIGATGLAVLWVERHGGGKRAIKEASDSGVRQQRTDLNWDLQQRAVRGGGGGHVDRTPACPRQPLCTSSSG